MSHSWFIPKEETERQHKASLLLELESERKAAEAQGVEIEGVPYSGDPANRAALLESVQFAREAGIETFAKWKDSSGGFHADYPLSCVENGLRVIGDRRGKLIAREAGYAAQIESGELANVEGLDWSV
ncbi:hypothetical protein HW452_16550 [Halomonas aquamarina]|uniref:Uncharacterized protein n=1 Tax=Vreelandella aquamarina TaxID=77097 RepID=A0ACC5VY11_9GAMM|nr:DUF4376 domain-containing protein [Halomonas aquamarina]MBZ5489131.1 hypothetical protein [Halomonas aquamarina]